MPDTKQTTKIEVKPNPKLFLTSDNYSVKVSGWEEEIVEIFTELEYKGEQELIMEEFIKIDSQEDDNIVNISINTPEGIRINRSRIHMKVPHTSQVQAEMENGSLRVNNLTGEQKFKAENGAIKLNTMNGTLDCESENGSVVFESCHAEINAQTENGSVKAVDCAGKMILKTENGALKLKRCMGELNAETQNGVVRLIEAGFTKATINSGNGGVYYG